MAFGLDWLGWTIFVFIVVTIIIIVIKILIEYPGLAELKCVYKDKDSRRTSIVQKGRKKMMKYLNQI